MAEEILPALERSAHEGGSLFPAPPGGAAGGPPPSQGAKRPRVVGWVAALFAWHALYGLLTLWMSARFFTRDPWGMFILPAAHVLWMWTCLGVLGPALLRGRRWGWAAAQGVLLMRSAAALSSPVAMFVVLQGAGRAWPATAYWPLLAMMLLNTGVVGGITLLMTVLLFRARDWFGVEPRRAWHTVRREGWWAIAITTALFAAQLLRFAGH